MKLLPLFLAIVWTVTFSLSEAFPKTESFYAYPLLNEKPMNLTNVSAASTGVLTLIKENPVSGRREKVPYLIYLRRAGKTINADSYAHNQAVTSIDVAEIVRSAQPGDELVIDPTMTTDKAGMRIIIIKNAVPVFHWFPTSTKDKDNC
jgi:hypothetical protein